MLLMLYLTQGPSINSVCILHVNNWKVPYPLNVPLPQSDPIVGSKVGLVFSTGQNSRGRSGLQYRFYIM